MAQSPNDLLDLLARTLAGNRIASERLAVWLRPSIREGVVCALFLADVRGARGWRGAADVDEFVQQTYVVLLENDKAALRNFSPTKGSGNLDAYVCRIAQHTTLGALRVKKSGRAEMPTAPEDLPDVPDNDADPEHATMSRDVLAQLMGALNLNEEAKELFSLHFIDGLDGPEICELIGMTPTAFWKWTSRVREKCKTILEKLEAPARST